MVKKSKSDVTALVTGGAGFIGSHIVDRLIKENVRVVVIDNESTGNRANVSPSAEYLYGDIKNPNDLTRAFDSGIDIVFHLAGRASNIQSFKDPVNDIGDNIIGTVNVLQTCMQYGVSRLLYASSMTAYGHPEKLPIREIENLSPISYYGITKYAAERYVLATALRNDLKYPINVTAFRMFNVFGERQKLDNPYQGALGFFLGNVLRNEPITIHSDGEQSRDFIYISDVVNAWMASINSPNTYQKTFNVGSGKETSINFLVDTILDVGGHSRATYPVQYGPLRPGDQRRIVADISSIQSHLGWKPLVDLKEGIDVTFKWARLVVNRN